MQPIKELPKILLLNQNIFKKYLVKKDEIISKL